MIKSEAPILASLHDCISGSDLIRSVHTNLDDSLHKLPSLLRGYTGYIEPWIEYHEDALIFLRCNLEKYDAIFLNFVIDVISEHSEVIKILETINKQLSPEGRVIIMYTPYEIFSLRWLFYRLRSLDVKGWHDKYRFQRMYYNSNEFLKIVDSCGFRVVGMIKPRFCHLFGDTLNKYLQILPVIFHSLIVLAVEKK